MTQAQAVLITGASTGIGATYADRFAKRGHDLVLVARDKGKLETLAADLRRQTGAAIEVIPADLTDKDDLARVEARLRDDARIGILVNNAGASLPGGYADPDLEAQDQLIRLNVVAVARLAGAVIPRFLARGDGAIINITSVMAFAPEMSPGLYAATKAFVLTFSQSLQTDLGKRGLYVQAVLPAATRTDIWKKSGHDVDQMTGVMDVGELVDAALLGFDRREAITIPPLPDAGEWAAFEVARKTMLSHIGQPHAAARYRAA